MTGDAPEPSARPDPPAAPASFSPLAADGRLIAGRFRLLEPLGRGGMGRVYRAQDELLGRLVAVKLIYDDAIVDSDVRHACALEARAAARLNHPGIVRILDSGFDDGHLYVVMSLAAGRTLSEVIRTDGPLPVARALEIAAQVADALEAAHREGIIHCDVKPGNLIVRPDGAVQLVDFGIAKIAASTTSLDSVTLQGSAEYVAPEQVEGAEVDGRTDLYALGVVLFESLTGRTPFGGGTIASVLARRLVNDAPALREFRPDAPSAVESVVQRMLARDPADRFQTAAAARDALQTARTSVLSATLPRPPAVPLTATMPLPRARSAALRARMADARASAGHRQRRLAAAGRHVTTQAVGAVARAGVVAAAALLFALRHARALSAWAGPALRARMAHGLTNSGAGARGVAGRAVRRPSLASSFGIAIVLGLLIGAGAAQCSVAGATTTTALAPETASAAPVDAMEDTPPPAPTAPIVQPAANVAPPPPPPTSPPAPTNTPAPTSAPSVPTSEPTAAPEQSAPAPESAPAQAAAPALPAPVEAPLPADPAPAHLLVAAPSRDSEDRPADDGQSEERQPGAAQKPTAPPKPEEKRPDQRPADEKKPEEKQVEQKRDEQPNPPARKPEAKKPENSGPPARSNGNGNGRGGGNEKPKPQERGNGNGPQKKR